MDDLSKRIAALSPAKRAVLEERLAREHVSKRRTVIPPRHAAGPVPLSFAQERLWFLASLEPENRAYNLARTFRLRGIPNISALERALSEIVGRHEALRTVIADGGDGAVQVVVTGKISVLRTIDLSMAAGGEQEAVRLAQEEISRPFDLRTGPLLRACLLRLAPQDHIFTLTFHHIASDGWSSAIFHRELSALYSAFCDGKTPDLQALPIQYGDYSLWQRQQLVGEQMESHLRYWRHHLADAPTLELPTDRPRAARPSYCGACHPIALPVDLCAKLRDFNLRENVTPFMSLLAAFEVLLARYSGQRDIVVGTPIANRRFAELENLIGFFVNSLAMRCDLSGEPSFRDLVSRVRRTALDAYQHQDLPFEKLVEELNPERDMSRHPLFQVMFAVQNAPRQALALTGLEVSWQGMPVSSTRFDLELHLCTEGDDWSGWFVYSRDLFEEATIEGMVRQYVALLEGMLAQPERPVSLVPMMSDRERQRILIEWNATRVNYPRDRCIHELFEEQAKRTPQAVAVVFGEEELSYGELDDRSGQLARYLRGLGVALGAPIAICIEPSVEMVVGLLGILKAGAAYVPIDPKYPQERISFMLADTEAAVLLTRKGLAAPFSGSGIKIACLDGDWETAERLDDAPQRSRAAESGDVAYVIFTSGSTGKPKGVCVPHRAVSRLVMNTDYVQLSASDVVAQVSNCCFDAATFEIWGALLNGSRLVGIEQERLLSPKSFSVELARHGVTTLFVTTALFNELVHERPDIFCKVRDVLFGGEECDPGAVGKVLESGAPERLLHVYGPTETTTFATWYHIRAGQSCAGRIPIGRPIANTQIYILDSHHNPVPIGVAGELCIGGEGVASGYLHRPELTAERFIESPFVSGQRLYCTGDLGRFLHDGNIEFLGRRDHQVKIRGFRIELGEIEATLTKHDGVRQAVVCAREDGWAGKARHLVAYVVPAEAQKSAQLIIELGAFLKQRLPDYMVPSAFVVLEKLPVTPNGKIDRGALPAPERKLEGYRAPRTPEEEILCGIFADLLSLERVGVDESFFSLGGHSLLAMQLVSRVRSALGVELPVRAVFEAPGVAELATRLPGAERAKTALVRQERPERLPLSFAQHRLWFLDRLEGSSTEYNMREALRLQGELDIAALEKAIHALAERHETLRTRFAEHEGEPFQVIEPVLRIPLQIEDLSGLEEAQRQESVKAAMRREAEGSFDLSQGPLLRMKLLKLGPRDHILMWTCHHVISDGWSVGIFNRGLSELYETFCNGRDDPPDALPLQYADYAIWQRSWSKGTESECALEYWRGQLTGTATLELPMARPRPARQSYSGARSSFVLGGELSARLGEFNRRENVTPFMSLLAAFEVLLFRYSRQEDISVGTPLANRPRVELEKLIGFFVNTLVMRVSLSGEPSFRDLVSRVRRTALDAYQHQDLPFEKLVEELNPERDMSRHPLFQVMFAVQNAPRQALALTGLEVSWQGMPVSSTRFDLELHLCTEGDDWSGWFVYSRDLFEEATIEGMVRQYVALLEGMLAQPERPVSLVPMMSDRERQRILIEWNATRVNYPRDRCIHELFEEQAKRTPQAVAVVFGEEELSYGELDDRSNKLAGYLSSLGVGARTRVAICLEPSVEMVVGLLGILKAGAAYVPIDPNYPQERISFMLADTQAAVLLTRKGLAAPFSGHGIKTVCLDGGWETTERLDDAPLRSRAAEAGDVAYVIFTSGSTGKPKGVCVPHRAVNRLVVNCDYVQLGADDVVAQVSNCCFDAATFEIWGALLNGSRLVGIEQEHLLSPESFSVELARRGVTTLFVTTALFNELVYQRPDIFCKVRNVLFGGEECDPGAVRKALESGAPERLLHVYGPTETTTFATWYPIPANQSCAGRIPIGRPIANTEIYLLDSHLHPVPVGMAGEIWVGGEGVASGYLDRPELTAERFVPSPFVPGQRLYRTGDLGRFLPDGNIDFLGRLDNQVKIRGFRVELGEIESVLRQHPCVGAAAVVVRENSNGGKQLVAYFVSSSSGSTPDQAELREFVRKELPDYMVPSAFVVLDRLPLTPNGKIDQKALPAPTLNQGRAGFVAPRNDTEKTVAEVWSALLNVEGIGADDNFFQLGGHSLLATRVVSRLRSIFGFDIPLHILFENATVAAIAEFIDSTRWATGGAFLSVVADREEFAI